MRIAKVALDNASKISQADKGKKEKKVDKESRDVQVSKEIKKFFDKKVGWGLSTLVIATGNSLDSMQPPAPLSPLAWPIGRGNLGTPFLPYGVHHPSTN